MPNIYEDLIGEAPSSQRVAELAAALRRRRSYGELGTLTGDKVLAPFGQRMAQSADSDAEALQGIRQKDIDNRQTQAYQSGQLGHMGRSLEETVRSNKQRDETTRRGQDLTYEAAMLRAAAAAKKASTPKPPKLTYADRNKLESLSNLLHGAETLAEGFKDDYTQKLGPGPQSRLVNSAAAMGIGTQGSKEASDWWAQWNLIYTLPQRNAMFGATLTPTEKQAWFNSDINPSMNGEQVRKRVNKVREILQSKAKLADKTYKAQGFDEEAIGAYELGEAEGELSADEQAELQALKKKYGRP